MGCGNTDELWLLGNTNERTPHVIHSLPTQPYPSLTDERTPLVSPSSSSTGTASSSPQSGEGARGGGCAAETRAGIGAAPAPTSGGSRTCRSGASRPKTRVGAVGVDLLGSTRRSSSPRPPATAAPSLRSCSPARSRRRRGVRPRACRPSCPFPALVLASQEGRRRRRKRAHP